LTMSRLRRAAEAGGDAARAAGAAASPAAANERKVRRSMAALRTFNGDPLRNSPYNKRTIGWCQCV
jgi:hypothetical protein